MLRIFILQSFRFHQALAHAHHLTAHPPWGMCKVLHLSGSVLGGLSHQIFMTMTCQRGNPERQPEGSSIPEPVTRRPITEVKLISWWKPSRGMIRRLLSKIIRVALLHNGRSKVIIMGRSVDNFRHSIMVVYAVLKLSIVGEYSWLAGTRTLSMMGAWASEDLASVSKPILETRLCLQGTKLQSYWTFASMCISVWSWDRWYHCHSCGSMAGS